MNFLGYMYERLDGSVRGEERFLAVQKFNEDEETFVFLLSTRAGNYDLSLCMRKPAIWVLIRSDTNRTVQSQKMARG